VAHFVERYGAEHGKHHPGFTHRAISALLNYDYPGNVRELENLIERAIILAPDGAPLDRQHLFESELSETDPVLALDRSGAILPAGLATAPAEADESLLSDLVERALDAAVLLDALELAAMKEAVRRADGNLSLAARQLGISRAQLAYRLDKQK
jgi:transcriptional regulator with PAS, ATPase and Fis domain